MGNSLLILGAGQYGVVVDEIAQSLHTFDKISFLDDKCVKIDNRESIIGKLDDYEKYVDWYRYAYVAIGNSEVRSKYIDRLKKVGYSIATLISLNACVSPSAEVKSGCLIEAGVIVNSKSVIGEGTIVCAGAIVNHNSYVGKCCTLQCGSIVPSNSVVPDKTVLNYGKIYGEVAEPCGK